VTEAKLSSSDVAAQTSMPSSEGMRRCSPTTRRAPVKRNSYDDSDSGADRQPARRLV
jgi:hypothetical protein